MTTPIKDSNEWTEQEWHNFALRIAGQLDGLTVAQAQKVLGIASQMVTAVRFHMDSPDFQTIVHAVKLDMELNP